MGTETQIAAGEEVKIPYYDFKTGKTTSLSEFEEEMKSHARHRIR